MGDAIGQVLAPAVGVAISPLALIAVILMLATPRGPVNGTAFTVGWVVALAALTTLVVVAGSELDTGGPRPTWSWWVKLAVGVLFLLIGARQWRGRPREGHVIAPPAWMRAVDRFTPARAAGLATMLVAANPKNLLLTVAGGVSIATSDASPAGKTAAAVLMVLVGSLCTLVPLGVHLLGSGSGSAGSGAGAGSDSAKLLGEWKAWMSTHNSAIVTVLLVVLGATYVGDALSGLSG
ncbi:GAP family protein [Kitasatospora sp. NPDC088346]|uniref:GAP family protein n=1 Tax=Kitasatospora sp. NPDC088346 TaxID=3364073 RepID=UPI00380D2F56